MKERLLSKQELSGYLRPKRLSIPTYEQETGLMVCRVSLAGGTTLEICTRDTTALSALLHSLDSTKTTSISNASPAMSINLVMPSSTEST